MTKIEQLNKANEYIGWMIKAGYGVDFHKKCIRFNEKMIKNMKPKKKKSY